MPLRHGFLLQEYGSGGAEVSATRYLGEIGVLQRGWLGDQGNWMKMGPIFLEIFEFDALNEMVKFGDFLL